MTEGQTEVDARRAALVVHAMSLDEQEWLMQQLAAPQRQLLEPLLQELKMIGIPRAPALLEDLKAASGDGAAERDAQSESLRRLLAVEPLRLTGAVLSVPDWPLAARLAAVVEPERRAAALLEAADARPAPALHDALIRAVQQAMTQEVPDATRAHRAGWRRMLESLRRRFA